MSSGGKLTVALYTLRHVHPGEELTFDYAGVTDFEKEFRSAICLCGTRHCRGSYLYYSGSTAFTQVRPHKAECCSGKAVAAVWLCCMQLVSRH